MKQGRLIPHTRSYNVTMGNKARKTHCSPKELQCKQWVMKQRRLIVHTRSYMYQWVMKQGRLCTEIIGKIDKTQGNKALN
ncbi:hypothetical protein KSS87_023942 [Heliosperma pusillum]|nr:hypothetical protein KSS87_023942 [Heliosperma pusillum]